MLDASLSLRSATSTKNSLLRDDDDFPLAQTFLRRARARVSCGFHDSPRPAWRRVKRRLAREKGFRESPLRSRRATSSLRVSTFLPFSRLCVFRRVTAHLRYRGEKRNEKRRRGVVVIIFSRGSRRESEFHIADPAVRIRRLGDVPGRFSRRASSRGRLVDLQALYGHNYCPIKGRGEPRRVPTAR